VGEKVVPWRVRDKLLATEDEVLFVAPLSVPDDAEDRLVLVGTVEGLKKRPVGEDRRDRRPHALAACLLNALSALLAHRGGPHPREVECLREREALVAVARSRSRPRDSGSRNSRSAGFPDRRRATAVIVVKRTQTDEIPATLREGRVPADHLLDRNERLQAIDLSFRETVPLLWRRGKGFRNGRHRKRFRGLQERQEVLAAVAEVDESSP